MKKQKTRKDDLFSAENISESTVKIKLLTPLTLQYANYYDKYLKLNHYKVDRIIIDFSQIDSFDTYLVVFINHLKSEADKHKIGLIIENLSKDKDDFYSLLNKRLGVQPAVSQHKNAIIRYFESIGNFAVTLTKDIYSFTEFIGSLFISLFKLLANPFSMRWKDFPFNFMRAGVNAVPIVLLIVFLIGLITGYQGALQLSQFGADKYIADLIGISITRELAPLMTGILVAGRSGSAFAAEIGTMKVSEEIDALKTMGIDLYRFLVLPRVLAVTVSIPLVTLLADISGILGGLIAAITTLNVTTAGYLNELQRALNYSHLFTGLGKSMIFGFLVAAVGCFRGLQASGGAESVGKFTTAAVVSGVLLIILTDAVFTFMFQILGI